MYLRIRPNSSQFFLEALIFVVLVTDFTASPGQVYDAFAAGIFFTTTIQNILEIAVVAVAVIMGLHTIVIVIVAATAAVAAATAATAANPISNVSDQR